MIWDDDSSSESESEPDSDSEESPEERIRRATAKLRAAEQDYRDQWKLEQQGKPHHFQRARKSLFNAMRDLDVLMERGARVNTQMIRNGDGKQEGVYDNQDFDEQLQEISRRIGVAERKAISARDKWQREKRIHFTQANPHVARAYSAYVNARRDWDRLVEDKRRMVREHATES